MYVFCQNKWGIAFGLLPQRDTDFYLRYLISEMIDFGQCIAADKLIKKYGTSLPCSHVEASEWVGNLTVG